MKKILALLLVFVMVLSFAACSNNDDTTGNNNVEGTDYNALLAGDYGEITLWVSESVLTDGTSVVSVTEQQIAEFQAKYPDIKFTYKVDGIGEGDAASKVLTDVASAPDIYCFAQDQLARLVQAGALVKVSNTFSTIVKEENDADAVSAGSVAGELYAFPLTADNGFYLYYDTSVFSEEDVEDLAKMVEVAENAGGKIRFALSNAWYNACFFYATGCYSNWSMNADGKWTGVDDTYYSDAGVIAMKGMQILTKSSCYDSDADTFTDAVAIVTGTWNSATAAEYFGDNLGATDLPSFTVDGNSYHLTSYYGCKLMGVKPQSDDATGNKTAVLQLLASYLTNEENQLERHEIFGWGPSNLSALESEAVKNDISLTAVYKQKENGVAQGNIHGSWWDIAKLLGTNSQEATTDDELRAALKEYDDAIHALLTLTDEELNAWSAIGTICGTNWDTDIALTLQEDGSYMSDVLALTAGQEYKVRQGASWDVNYGQDGAANGANIVVEADGNYRIKLTLGDTVVIELVAAE